MCVETACRVQIRICKFTFNRDQCCHCSVVLKSPVSKKIPLVDVEFLLIIGILSNHAVSAIKTLEMSELKCGVALSNEKC